MYGGNAPLSLSLFSLPKSTSTSKSKSNTASASASASALSAASPDWPSRSATSYVDRRLSAFLSPSLLLIRVPLWPSSRVPVALRCCLSLVDCRSPPVFLFYLCISYDFSLTQKWRLAGMQETAGSASKRTAAGNLEKLLFIQRPVCIVHMWHRRRRRRRVIDGNCRNTRGRHIVFSLFISRNLVQTKRGCSFGAPARALRSALRLISADDEVRRRVASVPSGRREVSARVPKPDHPRTALCRQACFWPALRDSRRDIRRRS